MGKYLTMGKLGNASPGSNKDGTARGTAVLLSLPQNQHGSGFITHQLLGGEISAPLQHPSHTELYRTGPGSRGVTLVAQHGHGTPEQSGGRAPQQLQGGQQEGWAASVSAAVCLGARNLCTSEQAWLTQGSAELGTAPLARSLLTGSWGGGEGDAMSCFTPPLGGPREPCGERGARGRLLFAGALQPLGHKTSTEQRVASNCKRKGKKEKKKKRKK